MLSDLRLSAYRHLTGFLIWASFRTQRVQALGLPRDGKVRYRPYAEAFPDMPLPGLFAAESFSASDEAGPRLLRIRAQKRLLALLRRLAPSEAPPVHRDPERFIECVYPYFFRRAWPAHPRVPPELQGPSCDKESDILAQLAIRGPFGSYLRRATPEEVRVGEASAKDYVIDLSWMLGYGTFEGLVRPGGKAVLSVRNGCLSTSAIHYRSPAGGGEDSMDAQRVRESLLAAMNEDLTTFRHNISAHLAILTPFTIATTNHLDTRHPIRRLLHHCFHTVLIGNQEVGEFQLSGPEGFSATIFSHDHRELTRMASDYLKRFDFWDFEPETQFSRRNTLQTPFGYPYRDNILQFWEVTYEYVAQYLRLYYAQDSAVRLDAQLGPWLTALDRLLPNGLRVPPKDRLTLDWIARLCATLIHVSTVEHDVLNNMVWDYSTLSWLVPTVVPASGELMDQRRAFDLIATLIGTWKPFNMLLSEEILRLALDGRAWRVMKRWIERLRRLQEELPKHPSRLELVYPSNLNVSVSN